MQLKLRPSYEYIQLKGIDEAMTALETLEHDLPKTELHRLHNFNQAYLIITRNVRQALRKESFEHPAFLKKFDGRFAYYYLRSLKAYVTDNSMPVAWQRAFDAARGRQLSPLVCMALGVNAHVNNDIPQVLADCHADKHYYRDYVYVNKVIEASIYEVIDALGADNRLWHPQRRLLKPVYKFVMKLLIRAWRYNAWRKFQRLCSGDANVAAIERSAQRIASGIVRLPV